MPISGIHDKQNKIKDDGRVKQLMYNFSVNEEDYTVSELKYNRERAGNNLIHRSKEYKHVTADVSKRGVILGQNGKTLTEFVKKGVKSLAS
ncbi:hypothetical protein [Pseudoalteromonas ostreae]|uniref:hypothetical protein n=1 Tax=Pseudoalteromonas ostreae TaxID=2774154 RepID=UPI001B379962|nr:hypothetical protein [Pseudoalteromonas ostreae]